MHHRYADFPKPKILPATAALLPSTTTFKIIAYGCTSAATVIGEQAVTDAVQSVLPKVAVTNPLSAIKAMLASLKARRIALLTPYVPAVSQALISSNSALAWHIQTLLGENN